MRALPASLGTVGFDLDMTLIDSRPGIAAVLDALAAETGTFIDSAMAVARLGPPLDEELANWYPPADVPAMGERFRALYPRSRSSRRWPCPVPGKRWTRCTGTAARCSS